jgi:hypothetical protein
MAVHLIPFSAANRFACTEAGYLSFLNKVFELFISSLPKWFVP